MALSLLSPLFFFFLLTPSLSLTSHPQTQTLKLTKPTTSNFSLSFPLTFSSSKQLLTTQPQSYALKSSFKYSMALIVSLPIGTPPQTQQMVLDTGSQLSWIQCHNKKPPPTSTFDPSLSSSFSLLPCTHPLCKPRIPDFTLPTSCDQNRLCHYSYFYADGTFAEGNLVREKFTFSKAQVTPPLILGCSQDTSASEGILGMNLGRLSFISQAKVTKFSYCTPARQTVTGVSSAGSFYLGQNPYSSGFGYVDLLIFSQSQSQRMPNFDPFAYTVPMDGIRIGNKRLNISGTVFRPNAGGSGQTLIDSGSQFTFLAGEAYSKVKAEVSRLVGPKLRKDYVYEGVADMCFNTADVAVIGRLIGDLGFVFANGVEIVVEKERVVVDVGGGVGCLGIGQSDLLGIASNIIGNIHQQNMWVEFDVGNNRIGFAKANCGV